jgi:hypothetical protein
MAIERSSVSGSPSGSTSVIVSGIRSVAPSKSPTLPPSKLDSTIGSDVPSTIISYSPSMFRPSSLVSRTTGANENSSSNPTAGSAAAASVSLIGAMEVFAILFGRGYRQIIWKTIIWEYVCLVYYRNVHHYYQIHIQRKLCIQSQY